VNQAGHFCLPSWRETIVIECILRERGNSCSKGSLEDRMLVRKLSSGNNFAMRSFGHPLAIELERHLCLR
jgi:hypothetical protein